MRKYGKVDANNDQIVSALRSAGAFVFSLASVGGGCPDLLVGFRGQTLLLEVKDGRRPPSQRKLTDDQLKFQREWLGGPLAVVDSPESALRMIGVLHANTAAK